MAGRCRGSDPFMRPGTWSPQPTPAHPLCPLCPVRHCTPALATRPRPSRPLSSHGRRVPTLRGWLGRSRDGCPRALRLRHAPWRDGAFSPSGAFSVFGAGAGEEEVGWSQRASSCAVGASATASMCTPRAWDPDERLMPFPHGCGKDGVSFRFV